jgi:hypothetical protein
MATIPKFYHKAALEGRGLYPILLVNILGIGMQYCFALDLFMTVTQFRIFYVLR